MPKRADGYQQSSGFTDDSSLYDSNTGTGYSRTVSGADSEVTLLLDLGPSPTAVHSLRVYQVFTEEGWNQPTWDHSNDGVSWTAASFAAGSAPAISLSCTLLTFDSTVILFSDTTARYWRCNLRTTKIFCSSTVCGAREVEVKDSSGVHINETAGPAPQSITPTALTESAESIPTPTLVSTTNLLVVSLTEQAESIPSPTMRYDQSLAIPSGVTDVEDFPAVTLTGENSVHPDVLTESAESIPNPSFVNSAGDSTLHVEALAEGAREIVAEPTLTASSSLRFRQCPDSRGVKWRAEVDVCTADGLSAAGCWLGNEYGVLYSTAGSVEFRVCPTPSTWAGATIYPTGFKGRVRGLALNAQGILMGLLDGDGSDSKVKGVSPIVSRDKGRTWEKMTSIPLTGDRGLAAVKGFFVVVETVTNGFRHYQSEDVGRTWL